MIKNIENECEVGENYLLSNCHPLQISDSGSETQVQKSRNIN